MVIAELDDREETTKISTGSGLISRSRDEFEPDFVGSVRTIGKIRGLGSGSCFRVFDLVFVFYNSDPVILGFDLVSTNRLYAEIMKDKYVVCTDDR